MKVDVRVTEVQYQDAIQNSDKFYRAYAVPEANLAVFQWGRRGAVGQFKVESHGSLEEARSACAEKIYAKIRKGYENEFHLSFALDLNKFNPKQPKSLAHLYEAAILDAPIVEPFKEPVEVLTSSSITVLSERALRAISLSVENPAKALEEYALVRADFVEVEEEFAKAASYIDTLEQLVREAVNA